MSGSSTATKQTALQLARIATGVVFQGSPEAMEEFGRTLQSRMPEGLQSVAEMASSVLLSNADRDSSAFLQFSQSTLQFLEDKEMIPSTQGLFGWNESGSGPSLTNIVKGAAKLDPNTAMILLAIETATKELTESLERIENRVGDIRTVLKAESIGKARSYRIVIRSLAEAIANAERDLTTTEWEGVAAAEREIVAAIEELRAYIELAVSTDGMKNSVTARADAATRLIETELDSTLALLVENYESLMSWHLIRIRRVEQTEPENLDAIQADAVSKLDEFREADQALIDCLVEFRRELLQPTGWEGLEPFDRRRLNRDCEQLAQVIVGFAAERYLDLPEEIVEELPGLRAIWAKASNATGSAWGWAAENKGSLVSVALLGPAAPLGAKVGRQATEFARGLGSGWKSSARPGALKDSAISKTKRFRRKTDPKPDSET